MRFRLLQLPALLAFEEYRWHMDILDLGAIIAKNANLSMSKPALWPFQRGAHLQATCCRSLLQVIASVDE